ncbi:MAG: pyruvate kinase [Pyrinomonadaceae bacterium]|nr:pyruvate kinase [Pyrinomonadaceae bacterium]
MMNDADSAERVKGRAKLAESVVRDLLEIRAEIVSETARSNKLLDGVHHNFRESARNLLHYLALRRRDVRPLQLRLAGLGLSSLGRTESHVLANIDAVLVAAHRLAGREWEPPPTSSLAVDHARGRALLAEHTESLLGPASRGRSVRIMVTIPSEAADDPALIRELLDQGMNCMRVNCAHDGPEEWTRMIAHLRRAEEDLGTPCRVVMDLAGPKLRTGPLAEGARVIRVRPKRDVYGRVKLPARVWLTAEESQKAPPTFADAVLPVPEAWLNHLRSGGTISLTDARNAKRTLNVVDRTDDGCWAEAHDTAYISSGTILRYIGGTGDAPQKEAQVGELPAKPAFLLIRKDDYLIITRDLEPGRDATFDSAGRVLTPAAIGCTIPEVFDEVRAGEAIWFDDGKIGGIVERITHERVIVRITQAAPEGSKLRSDKGINLPESALALSALTAKDIEDLQFVCRNADVVELSFANSAKDIEMLQENIEEMCSGTPAVVLKIETRRGFENLPDMLLAAMQMPRCGVMIARGDLAVECGFERLAEVQEEILWICEAAHVPVIWATQVLETLAKKGMPSRAEVTDAAMGDRAECVMLNKGPHVVDAVRSLDDILRRMQAHQRKKQAMMRELHLAHSVDSK